LDFSGSSVTGAGAYFDVDEFATIAGDISVNQSKSSLATGTYEVQLVAQKSNGIGGALQIISGAATVIKF
jgi:hypothetical protein